MATTLCIDFFLSLSFPITLGPLYLPPPSLAECVLPFSSPRPVVYLGVLLPSFWGSSVQFSHNRHVLHLLTTLQHHLSHHLRLCQVFVCFVFVYDLSSSYNSQQQQQQRLQQHIVLLVDKLFKPQTDSERERKYIVYNRSSPK